MEHVLEVYQTAYNPKIPVICMEFCHTPKHGSWLNVAEIELRILSRQCLDRRIPDLETLKSEVDAWQDNRNHEETWIDWRLQQPMPGLNYIDFTRQLLID